MKIALFDPYIPKFTGDMIKWWQDHGHEVKYDRYYDPSLIDWADVIWFDTCDNNLKSATNPSEALLADSGNYQPWDIYEHDLVGKKIIVRPIDIEVWYGHQAGSKWECVTDCIFIAPHIRDLMIKDLPSSIKIHTIPCGVNLDRYTFKNRTTGFNIAVISEKWTSKGTDLMLQIALKLKKINPRYKIHWLGKWSDYEWEIKYFEDFVKHHDLNFEFTEWIEGDNAANDFLEDKNYLLHASHKEAFSYATAEAMAKGIKPVVHRFYGGDALWPSLTWSSIDEAVEMITSLEYDSEKYYKYLLDREYTLGQMMAKIQDVLNA